MVVVVVVEVVVVVVEIEIVIVELGEVGRWLYY